MEYTQLTGNYFGGFYILEEAINMYTQANTKHCLLSY